MTTLVTFREFIGVALSDDDSYVTPLTYGSELILNGGMTSASNWNAAGGFSYSGGSQYYSVAGGSAGATLYQTQYVTAGDYYEVSFDIGTVSGTGWSFQFTCAGYTHSIISGATYGQGARTYKFVFQAVNGGGFLSTTGWNINAWTDGGSSFSVDNVSMKHLDTTSTMLAQTISGEVFPRASGFTNYSDDQSIWWVG